MYLSYVRNKIGSLYCQYLTKLSVKIDTNASNLTPFRFQVMLTGRHFVRDVACKKCSTKLGWIYEFATEETQRYKESHVILERALISESEGF